jgi:hypothetical protein
VEALLFFGAATNPSAVMAFAPDTDDFLRAAAMPNAAVAEGPVAAGEAISAANPSAVKGWTCADCIVGLQMLQSPSLAHRNYSQRCGPALCILQHNNTRKSQIHDISSCHSHHRISALQ